MSPLHEAPRRCATCAFWFAAAYDGQSGWVDAPPSDGVFALGSCFADPAHFLDDVKAPRVFAGWRCASWTPCNKEVGGCQAG